MSNIVNLPPNDKSGMYKAPPHSEGGFKLVIDNSKVAEAEGYEVELCPSVLESNEILHYENKTNKQILDDIFQKNACVMTQGYTTSGSFIVCKKAVLDDTKKDFNGSIKDFLNSIQSEHGCKVTEDAKEEFKKEKGGSISGELKDVISGEEVWKSAEKAGSEHNDGLESYEDDIKKNNYYLIDIPIDKILERDMDVKDFVENGISYYKTGDKEYSRKREIKQPIIIGGLDRGGAYMPEGVMDGSNRVAQATVNGQKEIKAYVPVDSIFVKEFMDLNKYNKKELKKGIKVEEEHKETLEKLAKGEIGVKEGIKEVAQAHLDEDPAYYKKLEEVENPFGRFIEIVKSSKDSKEAFEKAKKIKDVPQFVADEFSAKYNPDGKLSMQKAFEIFYNEYKNDSSDNKKEIDKLLEKKSNLESKLFEAKSSSHEVMNRIGFGAGMRRSKVSFSTSKEDEIANKIKVIDERIKELKGLNSKEIPNDEINKIIRDLSTMEAGLKDYDGSIYKSGYDKLLSSDKDSVLKEVKDYIQFQKDNAKYFTNKESKANADKWLDALIKLDSDLTKDFYKSEVVNEGVNSEKQELKDLIDLLKEQLQENPDDQESKDALELYEETLKNIESKFEKGGELNAEESIINAPCINKKFKFVESSDYNEYRRGGSINGMSKSELKEFYNSKEGKELDKQTHAKWKKLVNMSKSELEKFYNSEEGKEAGLSASEAKELGIDSGRESARWVMKMKDIPYTEWTSDMWRWAKKQIRFVSRMSGVKGDLYDDKGNKTPKHTALLIWGHNPEKYEEGGEVKGNNDAFYKAINKMISDGTNQDGKKNQIAVTAEFIRDFDLDNDSIIKSKYVDLSYWVKKAMPIHTSDYNNLVQSLYARQKANEINTTSLQFIYSFYPSDVIKFIPNWIIKAKKELKAQSPYLTEDTIAYANDYVSRLEAFVPIALKFEQMKSNIGVKKELTKEEKAQRERQKIQDDIYNSMPVINKESLSKLVSDIQKAVKPLEIEIYNREVKRYKSICEEYSKKEKVISSELDRVIPFNTEVFKFKVISAYEMNERKGYKVTVNYATNLSLKPNWESVVEREVKLYAENLKWKLIASVIKNFEKVTSPIKKITQQHLTVGADGFEGSYLVEFKNGGSFIFKTEAIGAGGYNIQVFHFRYISNFTDIKMPDGSKGNWYDLVSDDEYENGGAISFDKVISASTRFRPSETVVFDPPLEGKNGAKLISYTWSYEWTMKPSNEGELVSKRVSDWTQAEISADTGRDIVHQYTVLMPDGEYKTISSDSVPILLGYIDRKELKSFPNLVTASKTLAKQQMQLAILEAQKKETDELYDKFRNAEKPEVKKISNTDELPENIKKWNDLRGSENTYFSMGDIFIGQPNEHKWENQKVVYTEADKPDKYTIEQLTSQWISKRVTENGGKHPIGLYELKNRVARQKRKVENILSAKMEIGGEIEDFDYSSLFNEETPEEKENRHKKEIISKEQEKDDWYQKSKFSKKWAATLKEAIEKTVKSYFDAKATYEDWGSRQYKSNKGIVYGGGDDIHGSIYTIGGINENRRQRTMAGAKMQMDESIELLKELGLTKEEINSMLFESKGTLFASGGKIEVNKVSVYQTNFSGLSFSDLGGYFDSNFTDVIDLEDENVTLKGAPIFLFFKNPFDTRFSEKISIDDVIGAILPKKMEKDARSVFDKRFISYVTYSDDTSNEDKVEAIKKLANINEDIILK